MMDIIVRKSCKECPFASYHYDEFSMGDMEWYECNLALHLARDDDRLPYQSVVMKGKKIPKWCPLKQGAVSITKLKKQKQ